MATRKPAKKDFDMERMFQKLVPSLQQQEKPLIEELVQADLETKPGNTREVNLIKRIVLEKLEYTMQMLRACECDRCRSDVIALALNELPTFYAVGEELIPEKIAELRRRYEVKVTSALIQAVQRVKAEPRHGG